MHGTFESNKTEAILIANAGNALNWKALLYKIEYVCPINEMFLYNCLRYLFDFLLLAEKNLRLCEGATQGNPAPMAAYALSLSNLSKEVLNMLLL